MLQTIWIISKKGSNKSCSELNFLQKTLWTHISVSPRSGAKGLQRFPFLISYNVLYGKVGLPQGWMLQTICIISKKGSNKNCWELNFPQKTKWTLISISPWNEARILQRFPFSISYYILKLLQNYQNHDNSGINTHKFIF